MKFLTPKKLTLSALFLMLGSVTAFAQEAAATVGEEEVSEMAQKGSTLFWYYAGIALCVFMFLSIVGKVVKLLELSNELNGKKLNINWNWINGVMMGLFGIAFIYLTCWEMSSDGARLLPDSASIHGVITDKLFMVTFWCTLPVFIITHILLFWFGYKYKHDANRRAFFYPHNDRLEVIWTVVPAIVLAYLVFTGIRTWDNITHPNETPSLTIDVTAKQFGWFVRYPGNDNTLGTKKFKLITDANEVGVDYKNDKHASDDYFVKEIVLPVNKVVKFNFASRDVIHSAYMPHFRTQMNCVPGMPTQFSFTPTITTAQMREKLNDPKFEYLLFCAKICGNAHFNMQVNIKVVSEQEYAKWLTDQKPFYTAENQKAIEDAEKELMKKAPAAEEKHEIAMN